MHKPKEKPDSLCMAPWTHTYLSPQTERRMCCASREPAQNFRQYIDTAAGSGEYDPLTLEDHWNGDHMRSVRQRMMHGETLPECEVCNHKLLNTDVYRDYFWHLFKHRYDELWDLTDESGYTEMEPVSWDYRFSNLCNFACMQCGDMLSSQWESEQRKNDMINWDDPKNNWMKPDIRAKIKDFQVTQINEEFAKAVEEHRVEEIYWVGGEPLMFEEHWRYMKRIVELGDGGRVYARYNTNLSRVEYKGVHLYRDILPNIRDWQICASIDGLGEIGEYIRYGLSEANFLENYHMGCDIAQHPRNMRLDFTLTLPGLYCMKDMFNLSKETNTTLLSKVTFAFSPNIMMSPLALPRDILERIIYDFMDWAMHRGVDENQRPLIDVLKNLLNRPTFEEQWPDEYKQGQSDGKARIEHVESLRLLSCNLDDILRTEDTEAHEWWQSIT